MPIDNLVHEGYLRIYQQECGYYEEAIVFVLPGHHNTESLSGLIMEHLGEIIEFDGSHDVGQVRITIEWIEGGR